MNFAMTEKTIASLGERVSDGELTLDIASKAPSCSSCRTTRGSPTRSMRASTTFPSPCSRRALRAAPACRPTSAISSMPPSAPRWTAPPASPSWLRQFELVVHLAGVRTRTTRRVIQTLIHLRLIWVTS